MLLFSLLFPVFSFGFSSLMREVGNGQNLKKCYSMRLRDIPIVLQKTERSNDYYISAKIKDRLILFFQESCGQNIICVLHNHWKNTSKTLTYHKNYFDYYLEDDSQGFVRCTHSRGEEFLSFHVLVKRDNGKYFTDMYLVNLEDRFLISCPGGVYSKDVKLKVNGNYVNADYDPLRGFNISKSNFNQRNFYQCEKFGENNEIKGMVSTSNNSKTSTGLNATFSMKKQSFMYQTELQCIVEYPEKLFPKKLSIILSCPISTACPKMFEKQVDFQNQVVFTGMLNNSLPNFISMSEYYCVFLHDGEVVGHAVLEESDNQTILLVGISIIFIIVVISLIINSCGNLKAKTLSFISFKETQLLLEKAEQIGKGHSATVHVVQIRGSCEKIVVKYSKKATQFQKELKMLQTLNHPNIVPLLGTTEFPVKKSCYSAKIQHLVLPYYPKKSLHEFINKFTPYKFRMEADQPVFSSINDDHEEISLFDLISISMQVGMALEYLKEKEITHRDVALRNVLISHDRICKLADFERAKHGETRKISFTGECQKKLRKSRTLRKFVKSKKMPADIYPIEALDGYYFYASEVYSFGNLLLTLFKFGETKPFHSWEHYTLNLQKVPDPPEKCPTEIYNVIVKCMQFDHKSRPDIGRCVDAIKYFAQNLSERKFFNLQDVLEDEAKRDIIEEHRPGGIKDGSDYPDGPYRIQFESFIQDSAV